MPDRDPSRGSPREIHPRAEFSSPVYERHLSSYRNKPLLLLEVGTKDLDALSAWQSILGPLARIVGIAASGEATANPDRVALRVGARDDPAFLQSVLDEFGIPDVVVETGVRSMENVGVAFSYLYARQRAKGIYIIEGLANSQPAVNSPSEFLERLAPYCGEPFVRPDSISRATFGLHLYRGVAVFEKRRPAHAGS